MYIQKVVRMNVLNEKKNINLVSHGFELYQNYIMWPAETEVMVSQLCLMCGST